ncbi:MAG: glycosyltransferase [Treponemataceae bacterium]
MKTGAGHYSGAKSIYEKLKIMDPEAELLLCDGLENCLSFFNLFLETGYSITSNRFMLSFVLFYHSTNLKFVQKFLYWLLSPFLSIHIRRKIRTEKFTKIICTHQILTPILSRVCKELKLDIPIFLVVMDPFSMHSLWFSERDVKLIVLSSYAKKVAIERHKFPKEKVFEATPIFSEKFNTVLSKPEVNKVKTNLGISLEKKVLLIAGGGEGLASANKILKVFLKNNFNDQIIIVCGKNKNLKKKLEKTVKKYGAKNVLVLGFVNIMYELINIADCVISKGGPGTIMEVLATKKTLIVSSFIRYQEYGNLFFVEQNKAGWYIPQAKQIYKKVVELFSGKLNPKTKDIKIENGLDKITKFVQTKNS